MSSDSATATSRKTNICRWGILGCANIAIKCCRAITLSRFGTVAVVASRSPRKAKDFVQNRLNLDLTKVRTCNYDELVLDSEVDAVYIPLPTSLHLEWVVRCANAKKHVLVEKPVAVDAKQLARMLEVCLANNVLFMDGVMFMHHDRTARLTELLTHDPSRFLGDVERITSAFSFRASRAFWGCGPGAPPGTEGEGRDIRLRRDGDRLGALGDLGWYCVRVAIVAFQSVQVPGPPVFGGSRLLPRAASARSTRVSADGNPVDLSGEVFFGPDRSRCLSFHCSFVHSSRQWVEIATSTKLVTMDDFVNPCSTSESNLKVRHFPVDGDPGVDLQTHFVQSDETIRFWNCSQERNQFDCFSEKVLDGALVNNDKIWMAYSWVTQVVVDALMLSANADGEMITISTENWSHDFVRDFVPSAAEGVDS